MAVACHCLSVSSVSLRAAPGTRRGAPGRVDLLVCPPARWHTLARLPRPLQAQPSALRRRSCPAVAPVSPDEQSGNRSCLFFRALWPHTMQSLGHPLPALGRSSVRFHDVLLGHGAFPPPPPPLVFPPALFGGFAGTMPVFDPSLAYLPGLRFWLPRPVRRPGRLPDADEVSRFSRVPFLDVRMAPGLRRA